MANRTDPTAAAVHGLNPQFLIEQIVRNRIYSSTFWKEHCFSLTAETLLDKAVTLKYEYHFWLQFRSYGGVYGGNQKPTHFLCLLLKMLQIQPEKEIVIELINNKDFK